MILDLREKTQIGREGEPRENVLSPQAWFGSVARTPMGSLWTNLDLLVDVGRFGAEAIPLLLCLVDHLLAYHGVERGRSSITKVTYRVGVSLVRGEGITGSAFSATMREPEALR